MSITNDLCPQCLAKDNDGDTALHLAVLGGSLSTVCTLIDEFKCDPYTKGSQGRTPVHQAANKGHIDIVRKLVRVYGCDVMAKDNDGSTPLHLAVLGGSLSTVCTLIDEFKCDPKTKGFKGRTPLHHAAQNGHSDMVRKLVRVYGCDVIAKDNDGDTPFHLAALGGSLSTVCTLIDEFKCDLNAKGFKGRTPLHHAAQNGHSDIVRKLVRVYGCDVMAKDNGGNTPLHQAALEGSLSTVCTLIDEFKCDPNTKGSQGRTPVHQAANNGHIDIVRKLVSVYGCDVMAKDNDGSTPLHLAVLGGSLSTVYTLIDEFKCDLNAKEFKGSTPLHHATQNGHIDIVRKLVRNYGCDVMAKDDDGNTPLHLAALGGSLSTVCTLIDVLKCDPNTKGFKGRTPVHQAAQNGHSDIVRKLVCVYGCDIMAKDNDGDTPLHLAALGGSLSTMCTLIDEFKCDPNTKGFRGRTPVHQAAQNGHSDIVRKLFHVYECDVNAVDNDGHNPMYIAKNHQMKAELMKYNCDPGAIIKNYKMMKKSLCDTVSSHVLVVGHPRAGKSTLVEALKSDTWFSRQVADVPPHTAGIIPHTCQDKRYDRIIFHDFAGHPEFYSCHAAILEQIANPECHIVIVVVDLSTGTKAETEAIMFWLTFMSYATKGEAKVIIAGSHADLLPTSARDPEEELSQLCSDATDMFKSEFPSTNLEIVGHVALDCRYTKSQPLLNLHFMLKSCFKTKKLNLSPGAVILHHVLSQVTEDQVLGCVFYKLYKDRNYIANYLPTDHQYLLSWAKELESHGYVLVLQNNSNPSDSWIVTDLKMFMNTVHEGLFSEKANTKRGPSSKLGLIPIPQLRVLFPHLPPSVLVSCLELLQYCFKMDDHNILIQELKAKQNSSISDRTEYLFFPALLEAGRSEVTWYICEGDLYAQGWYLSCKGQCSFLPPRFDYVLLLKLALDYSLPDGKGTDHTHHGGLGRRCTVWKIGIHWLMEIGVEGYVEVVKEGRGVVVVMRSRRELKMECGRMLKMMVDEVHDALGRFCEGLVTTEYILDPRQLHVLPNIDALLLFSLNEVKEMFTVGKNMVIDVTGRAGLMSSDIDFLQQYPLWGEF